MIARDDYVGPITKSAQAMFARAERRARQPAPRRDAEGRPMSPIRQAVHALGLTLTVLRQWEDAGLIAFDRVRGRRVVDEAAIERLSLVVQLRRAGFTVREIGWIDDAVPPGVPALRRALQTRSVA